jgi:hypothetical protein
MLTAKELKMSPEELEALHHVRGELASGAIPHNPTPTYHNVSKSPDRLIFNMGEFGMKADCGTIACIGGHMALILGEGSPGVRRRWKPRKTISGFVLPAIHVIWLWPHNRCSSSPGH